MGIVAPLIAGIGGAATASTALTVGSGIFRAVGASQQARASAAQADQQAQDLRTRADEIQAARLDELQRTLSTFAAARGANNTPRSSPTSRAIRGDIRRTSLQDIRSEVGNIRRQATSLQNTASARRAGGRASLLTGVLNTGPSILSLFQ